MAAAVSMAGSSAAFESGGRTVLLDPKSPGASGINFVSHAHLDHLPSRNGGVMLASAETTAIAGLRGLEMENHTDSVEGLELVDSGHILGSKGLLFDETFYTGDICTRDRGFLRGARVPRCRTLVTECTFGLPEFAFPGTDEVRGRVNELIAGLYGRGVPVILMGYELGKAQTLTEMFGHWQPLYLHDSVLRMNELHRRLGVPLAGAVGHTEAEAAGLLARGPWVMVSPVLPEKHEFVSRMRSRYGAVTVGFSGWAGSRRFKFGRRTDYSFQMSDHCDFAELVGMVAASGAERVYTVHGFVDEFAAHLRGMGIDASPLAGSAGP